MKHSFSLYSHKQFSIFNICSPRELLFSFFFSTPWNGHDPIWNPPLTDQPNLSHSTCVLPANRCHWIIHLPYRLGAYFHQYMNTQKPQLSCATSYRVISTVDKRFYWKRAVYRWPTSLSKPWLWIPDFLSIWKYTKMTQYQQKTKYK